MGKYDDARMTTRLQFCEAEERQSAHDRRLRVAAEAQHRARILSGEGARLEDLAVEWIELLRASIRKTAG